MSTKTIAVDTQVYTRLAAVRRESESFSKAIDRILDEVRSRGTGEEVLGKLRDFPSISGADAQRIMDGVTESRAQEAWDSHDLS